MLWTSQPRLGAATLRVRLHFPSRDQVGLQAWRETERKTERETDRETEESERGRGFSHPCVYEGTGGCGVVLGFRRMNSLSELCKRALA